MRQSFLIIKIILIMFVFYTQWIIAQEDTKEKENLDKATTKLQKQLDELNKLYTNLRSTIEDNKNQTEQAVTTLKKTLTELSQETQSNYSTANNRVESIEKIVKISNEEKKKNLNQNVERNQAVQENFSQYIKFYGDKYSQLDEKVTSEELALELRKIINPQSGSLGYKLSDKLNGTMQTQFNLMVDEVMKNNNQEKANIKKKIDNALNAVTSTLNNPIISDVVGSIPFGSSVKNIVGTVSGLVVNMFDEKKIKKEFREKILERVMFYQKAVLNDLNDIITFYDKMTKLDNQYEISIQNIRNDVGILGIELREFCIGLETPLKKVDPTFSIDKTKSIREISIQISDKFDELRKNQDVNMNNLNIITNLSFEIKNRSRELYNRYREIQESKILANNKFVGQFTEIIENSRVAASPQNLSQKLQKKNTELIDMMKRNHVLDKSEFEKYLDKITELN